MTKTNDAFMGLRSKVAKVCAGWMEPAEVDRGGKLVQLQRPWKGGDALQTSESA